MMTMRCSIERESETGQVDGWGRGAPTLTRIATDQPCWIWSSDHSYITSEIIRVQIGRWKAIFPSRLLDIRAGDLIDDVVDRLGASLFDSARWRITGSWRRPGYLVTALETIDGR